MLCSIRGARVLLPRSPCTPHPAFNTPLRLPPSRRLRTVKMSTAELAASASSRPKTEDGPSAPEKPANPLAPLQELNRSVLIYRPSPGAKTKSSVPIASEVAPPKVILIFGWMDAPARLVVKYAQPWIERFPQATVIVKLSTAQLFMASKKDKEAMTRRLADLVRDEAQTQERRSSLRAEIGRLEQEVGEVSLVADKQAAARKDPGDSTVTLIEKDEANSMKGSTASLASPAEALPSGLFIHTFSDGGSTNFSLLQEHFASHTSPVPTPRLHIIDSSPGISTARSTSTAFAMAFQKKPRVVYWTYRIAVWLVMKLFLFVKRITGSPTRSATLRWRLNEPKKWDWPGQVGVKPRLQAQKGLVPRLYLFSKVDALIDHEAVELHARDCAQLRSLPEPKVVEMDPSGASGEDASARVGEMADSPIQMRRWKNAAHCSIGRHDFEGYWAAIDAFVRAHAKDPAV